MYIDSQGRKWFKGNLHTHTTMSDGQRTPEEAAALYRAAGYDFLVVTDHWKVSETFVNEDGLLLVAGCEYDVGRNVRDGIFHITSFGCTETPVCDRSMTPDAIIDEIHRCGGIANLAHPAWSMNTCEQLLPVIDGEVKPLFGADVTEIYNSVSGLPRNCRPYSGIVLDLMAARGYFTMPVADDDTHWYGAETCLSYIMVQAEECTREALIEAIRAGRFYATQGPEISVTKDGDTIRVTCSPAESVVYFTDTAWCPTRADVGHGLTESSFRMTNETFVRVEVTDADGKTAWSGYFGK
ncbi:MAG: CehA/McbA family metallohydrolase [Clostridia bacterium]|nr:CehA/McbA family metallohydrolase [Clostridia bacterium]